MAPLIREMTIEDYPQVFALWKRTEGMGLGESDEEPAVRTFLLRNPGMSCVALGPGGSLAGAVLCGHDGRRGYIHHLAVAAEHRRKGIARQMLAFCFERLGRQDIPKCNIYLFANNAEGRTFWLHSGWNLRSDLHILQKAVPQAPRQAD